MKIYSFGTLTSSHMKKIAVLSFFIAATFALAAQSSTNNATIKIAYGLDSLNYPKYGDIYLMDGETDFYVVAEDVKPIQCNKLKVYAYYKDLVNGTKGNDYWVYQGAFDFSIVPYYKSYSLSLKAYKVGEYKVAVSGYMNNSYFKNFGSKTFTVKDGNSDFDLDYYFYLLDN